MNNNVICLIYVYFFNHSTVPVLETKPRVELEGCFSGQECLLLLQRTWVCCLSSTPVRRLAVTCHSRSRGSDIIFWFPWVLTHMYVRAHMFMYMPACTHANDYSLNPQSFRGGIFFILWVFSIMYLDPIHAPSLPIHRLLLQPPPQIKQNLRKKGKKK